ncbi:MAG: hypothetical protein GY811_15350 [Myxococcales bacterium]|nr:hypothetical protein [Myxococcales bacterium]
MECGSTENLRVALAWAHHALPSPLEVTDDQPWPLGLDTLAFELAEFPSEETIFDWNVKQGALSVGGLMVYEDTNDDGEFDFTKLGDELFQDRVVGWSPGLRIVSAPADVDPQRGVQL